jgi:hypothetical protein
MAKRKPTELQRQSGNHQPPGSTEPFRGKPGRRPRRLGRPVRAWAGSQTAEVTRDALQKLLVGPPKLEGEWGTGLIPGDDLVGLGATPGCARCNATVSANICYSKAVKRRSALAPFKRTERASRTYRA